MLVSHQQQGASLWVCSANSLARNAMSAPTRCLPKFRNPRFPFASNALKIWEVRNFPLAFLGQVRNIPHVEFSPAEKTLYGNPPPPVQNTVTTNELHTAVSLDMDVVVCDICSSYAPISGCCAPKMHL